ncbi:MAG: MFS transporter [SAR202 cluster bacterium]|nr:MFS transporter [SAR202 cluster bacterium]
MHKYTQPLLHTFQALQNTTYRKLWGTACLLYVARMIEMVCLSWLVLELTDSPSKVAFVGIARMVPMAVFGLIAGTISDRIPKILILKYVQGLNIVVSLVMLVLIQSNSIVYWHSYLSILLTGSGWVLDFTARRALYPELFSGRILTNAISLDTASLTGSMMLGSILGGLAINMGGFSTAYILMISMYILALILFINISTDNPKKQDNYEQGINETIKEYLYTLRSNKLIRSTFLVTLALNFFGFPYMLMVPVIARDSLGANELLFGILLSAAGTGALLGSLVIASLNINRKGLVYVFGSIIMLIALLIFSMSSSYHFSLIALFVAGLGTSGFGTMQVIISLSAVPQNLRGRAMGVIALGIGSSPLGTLLVGTLADTYGAQTALGLLTSVGILVMSSLWFLLPELRRKIM